MLNKNEILFIYVRVASVILNLRKFLENVGHMNLEQTQQGWPKCRLVLYQATLNEIPEGNTQTLLRWSWHVGWDLWGFPFHAETRDFPIYFLTRRYIATLKAPRYPLF